MIPENPTSQPLQEEPLSDFELKRYGFTMQPLVTNGTIRSTGARYVANYDESWRSINRQSFEAGMWEARSPYEKERTTTASLIQELRAENERLQSWKQMLEAAPGESAEVIRERCLSSDYLQPIVASWKKANAALQERLASLREAVRVAKEALVRCSKWMPQAQDIQQAIFSIDKELDNPA